MDAESENTLNQGTIWSRGLYMLLFAFFLWLAKFVAFAVVVVQFFTVVLTGTTNVRLLTFGQSLSIYHYQVFLFLTFNSEQHPYPIGEWPEGAPLASDNDNNDDVI